MKTPDAPKSPCLEQPPLFDTPADPVPAALPSQVPASSGCPRLRTANRQQIIFRTAALDELIPLDHPARIVWDYVQGLDLSPLYDRVKAVERGPGRGVLKIRPPGAPEFPPVLLRFRACSRPHLKPSRLDRQCGVLIPPSRRAWF